MLVQAFQHARLADVGHVGLGLWAQHLADRVVCGTQLLDQFSELIIYFLWLLIGSILLFLALLQLGLVYRVIKAHTRDCTLDVLIHERIAALLEVALLQLLKLDSPLLVLFEQLLHGPDLAALLDLGVVFLALLGHR